MASIRQLRDYSRLSYRRADRDMPNIQGGIMKRAVKTGLPSVNRPIEWAVIADGILYTAQLPLKADGSFDTGDIGAQTELTLTNLKRTVEAAGGTLADVTQILVYMPDPKDFEGMNAVYGRYFPKPYPNRATLIANLVVPGARIEIIAYAHIGHAMKAATRAKSKTKAANKGRSTRGTAKGTGRKQGR
jgi:enamine deaminase RidA (YjgF/YER057c/UK114 family)